MNEIIAAIRQELKANSDDNSRNNYQGFFKEKVTLLWCQNQHSNKIVNKNWNEVKQQATGGF